MSGLRKALIVANDEYEQEALRNLQAPAADAEALARVLGDPQIGDFAVQVMCNEPSYAIQTQIEEMLSGAKPDDILLMHFSCHGLKSESGELYFAAANTRPNLLRSSAVSADFLRQGMAASRSRSVVLFLDCCYGGAFAQGGIARAGGDVNVLDSFREEMPGAGKGTAVITASDSMEYAFEGERLADDRRQRPSLFTSALVQGLATGDADKDEDGWVSLNELYNFVYDKVHDENPQQTPTRLFDLAGELYLTRSQRRRVRPAPLPAGLKAALTNPDMYARLGAIGELRSRLASDDLPVAAGACEALADLVRNDIQYVAEVAAAALKEAALQPAQADVQFGQVEQGATSPHRTVRLLGLPIARVCAPRASDDWIRVVQAAEGLDVSVATDGTGSLRGDVNLKGVACEAAVAVYVDLVAAQSPATQDPPVVVLEVREEAPQEVREEAPQTPPPHYDTFSPPRTTQQSSPTSPRKSPAKPGPAEPGLAETSSRADSQQGLARETTTGKPERQSSTPIVWAAGSAVLGVVLLIIALQLSVKFSGWIIWQTMLAVAVLGALIAFFERPLKRLETFVHGWNFVWFIFLALFVLELHRESLAGYRDQLIALTVIGAVGNAICAVFAFARVARDGGSAANIIPSITVSLITVGFVVQVIAVVNFYSLGIETGAGIVLFAASLASLLESVVVLAGRSRSSTDSDGAIAGPVLG
jgi:Caspase domain